MKSSLLLTALMSLLLLSGCAGLSVNWDFDMKATYRSEVPVGERSK